MYALVIGRTYPDKKTGMMGIFEFEQALALNKYGYKVVYSFCDTRSVKGLRKYGPVNITSGDVPIYGYHLPIGGLPRGIFNSIKRSHFESVLKELINKEGIPDIIYIHFPLLTLNDGIWDILKSLKRPIVVTEHWSKILTKEIQQRYVDFLNRIVAEADEFTCVGHTLKKSIVELTNTNRDIKVIPNMVSPLFYYEPKEESNIFNFVAIGRIVESKRFDLVIEAFNKAFDINSDVRLTIAGNGPLFSKHKKMINELGENHRIDMPGFLEREKLANLLRKSGAYVSASTLETFGVPYIEAMACGKPVIGVKGGAIDPYVNEDNGVLIRQDNVDDLVNALKYIYENKNKFNEEGIARNTAGVFSEEAILKELDALFVDLRGDDIYDKN